MGILAGRHSDYASMSQTRGSLSVETATRFFRVTFHSDGLHTSPSIVLICLGWRMRCHHPYGVRIYYIKEIKIMKLKYTLAMMATLSLAGCGGSDGDSTNTTVDPVTDESPLTPTTEDEDATDVDEDLIPDDTSTPSTDGYPSNEELTAAGGIPTVEEAQSLIVGSWISVDDATQCVTIFEFSDSNDFVTSSLDQRGSGEYRVLDDDGALDANFSYETENFQTDCLGFMADADSLDSGVSYSYYISFDDQDTMNFSNSRSGTRTIFTFSRQ